MLVSETKIEDNSELLGGFDDFEFESNVLIEVIDLINELTDGEYEFVIRNNKHAKKVKGIAK